MKNQQQEINICWLRRDLRIEDNTALYHALHSSFPVLVIFIYDTAILNLLTEKEDKRVVFIRENLEKINKVLQKNKSSLYVLHDTPIYAFEKICSQFDVKEVFTNHDYEPYAIARDLAIEKFLSEKNIDFHTYKDQVIFEKSEVMKPDGKPYTIYTPYSKIWKQKFNQEKIKSFPSESHLSHLFKTEPFHFLSLKEIGFKEVASGIPDLHIDENTIRNYKETRNFPGVNGTSHVSVHLRFGTISVRHLVELANKWNETWLNELIWREFFMMILFQFPSVVNKSFKEKYDHIKWRNNEDEFESWCKGETGYPMVDAGMRQLNETGYMHNRVRMVVASFLTKHLLIDWRWGEAYFAEKLLDYELSSNNGNWQWAAGSGCDAAPYFRIFNPSEQIRKFDPELVYIKKWITDFRPGYVEEIVKHDFARKRALEVYKKSLQE
ncbi:MAG: deoxyribodipyrimidine photo-lyase, partial [Ginsengibacter sp.]